MRQSVTTPPTSSRSQAAEELPCFICYAKDATLYQLLQAAKREVGMKNEDLKIGTIWDVMCKTSTSGREELYLLTVIYFIISTYGNRCCWSPVGVFSSPTPQLPVGDSVSPSHF